MRSALAIGMLLAAPAAWADQIFLAGGGVVHGEVVSRTASALVVEVGPGRMTLPMARVARVVESKSDLTAYRERAAALSSHDVAGWLALARFAESRELLTQAREAYERVLAVDPGNAAANAGLGRVQVNGHWLSREDAFRARGLVPFDGDWVTPEQHAAILADRIAAARAREASLEAGARAREAEARARVAEAEARRAEADAAASSSGIPYPYVYGGGYGYGGEIHGGGQDGRHRGRLGRAHPYAQTSYGYGGPYGGVYGPDGMRHAGSPGWGARPVATPHGAPRPARDTGGSARPPGDRRR
jgi:hypothetical protein